MQLFYICYSRAIRCVIVTLFLFVLVFSSAFGMKGNMIKLPDESTTVQIIAVHNDRIVSKSYKMPEPIAALVKKEAFSYSKYMQGSSFHREYSSKFERLMGFLAPKNDNKNQNRYYIFCLLGVLVLLKKQSVITYLHKRDVSGGPVCPFAI